ncbi:MAG TPA: N-acetylmuramoyl-L-alanine amidase, partial [Longimicrobiales bacterium]
MSKEILDRPSPNHNARPAGVRPDLIVIHGTAGETDAGDLAWCRDPKSQVSYHYLIGRDGRIYRLVPEERRAWHAGVSGWEGRQGCNDYSIGVGLCNDGREPYTPAQYDA